MRQQSLGATTSDGHSGLSFPCRPIGCEHEFVKLSYSGTLCHSGWKKNNGDGASLFRVYSGDRVTLSRVACFSCGAGFSNVACLPAITSKTMPT